MTAEMALYHLSQGKSVLGHLHDIYMKYGYYQELLISRYFKGQSGVETMKNLIDSLRTNPPMQWGDETLVTIKDYKQQTIVDGQSKKVVADIDLPVSNVLQFVLSKGTEGLKGSPRSLQSPFAYLFQDSRKLSKAATVR